MTDFKKISQQIKALDTPEKLKIVSLLAEEGKKSISDIARELKLHFSTTHKYLEQLEKAELVHSQTVKEDRLKRYFYINDFAIKISPTSLTQKQTTAHAKQIKVLIDSGELKDFDESMIIQKYLDKGLPIHFIQTALKSALRNAYDYITFAEIMKKIHDELNAKTKQLNQSLNESLLPRKSYFERLYRDCSEIIKLHCDGAVFIDNLATPKLRNFVHDIRGIGIHGITGEKISDLRSLLNHILTAIKSVAKIAKPNQSLDSFNYFIAPFITNPAESKKILEEFLMQLEELNITFTINLDVGVPEYAKEISPHYYFLPKTKIKGYEYFSEIAATINRAVFQIAEKRKFKNIKLILKCWNQPIPKLNLNSYYVTNMNSDWQKINAGYTTNSRFGADWQGWMRTLRCGEIQKITINLPLLAVNSNKKDFLSKLKHVLEKTIEAHNIIAEVSKGFFLRSLHTVFPSLRRKKWNYVPIEDGVYSIALYGINKIKDILPSSSNNITEELLVLCNHSLSKYNYPLRLAMSEIIDENVIKRFSKINASIKAPVGPTTSDPTLHKYLSGGHLINVKKSDIGKLSNIEFGLAKIS